MLNFIASAYIPQGNDPFNTIVFGLLTGLVGIVGSYGVAIILFSLILRLALAPLDVLNKYFTKRNASRTAEFKDEDAELKKQYAADPMKYMAARREMYRRNGYKAGPSSLIMVANTVVTMMVFFAVFACLGQVSTANLRLQSEELGKEYMRQEIAQTIKDENDEYTTEFSEGINDVYGQYNERFLWVHNVFRPDTWTSRAPSLTEFGNAVWELEFDEAVLAAVEIDEQEVLNGLRPNATDEQKAQALADARRTEYINQMHASIIANLYPRNSSGWNGYLVLAVLVPVIMYFSMQVNMTAMQKRKAEAEKKEAEVGYSMRQAKAQVDPAAMPQIDPQKMMKYMKFLMPALMIMFAIQSAAAFALYIAAGAILQTTMGLGTNKLIEKIIKKQEAKRDADKPTHPVINPHTRYFKKSGGGK